MAIRGVVTVTDTGGWQDVGRTTITCDYRGFTHFNEGFAFPLDMTPSILTGILLKAAVREKVVEFYSANPSQDWDPWDSTPIVGDDFILVGGVL